MRPFDFLFIYREILGALSIICFFQAILRITNIARLLTSLFVALIRIGLNVFDGLSTKHTNPFFQCEKWHLFCINEYTGNTYVSICYQWCRLKCALKWCFLSLVLFSIRLTAEMIIGVTRCISIENRPLELWCLKERRYHLLANISEYLCGSCGKDSVAALEFHTVKLPLFSTRIDTHSYLFI